MPLTRAASLLVLILVAVLGGYGFGYCQGRQAVLDEATANGARVLRYDVRTGESWYEWHRWDGRR